MRMPFQEESDNDGDDGDVLFVKDTRYLPGRRLPLPPLDSVIELDSFSSTTTTMTTIPLPIPRTSMAVRCKSSQRRRREKEARRLLPLASYLLQLSSIPCRAVGAYSIPTTNDRHDFGATLGETGADSGRENTLWTQGIECDQCGKVNTN